MRGSIRDRCITLSATVPCSRRGRNRTLGPVLIRDLLSPLSYAPIVGPKGFEPLLARLKVRRASSYTTTLCSVGCMRFKRVFICISSLLCFVVPSGSPESRTQHHSVISRVWATGPRLPSKSGWQDSNLRSRAPNDHAMHGARRADHCPTSRFSQNGRI